jgi:TonB-dependent receptor
MRISLIYTLTLLGFLAGPPAALARPALPAQNSSEAQNGTLSGRVVDASGGVVPGSMVTIQPTGNSIASDSQGRFTFENLPPGSYTVTVNHSGFATFTGNVTISAGGRSSLDVTLSVAAASQQVVVRGVYQGQAEAVQLQETSPNIVNAITAQQIASLPNANVADAVGRLPGVTLERDEGEGKYIQVRGTQPRMNQVTVDGVVLPSEEADVSEVKLDAVPADLVNDIVLNKTLSANQPGNAIGGSADLQLREAADTPTISLNAVGGYTPIANGHHLDQFDGTFGDRFGPGKRFGAIFTGSYDLNDRGIDDLEPTPDPNFATPYYDGAELRQYLYYRTRYGYSGSLDYRLGQDHGQGGGLPSDIYVHYFYSAFWDDADVYHYVINDALYGGNNGQPDFNSSNRREDFFLGMLDLGGSHVFSKSYLDWSLAASDGRELNAAGDPGVDFPYSGDPSNSCSYDAAATKNQNEPQWNCDGPLGPNNFVYNPNNYSMGQLTTGNGPTGQVNLQASLNYGRDYSFGSHSGTFQIGFSTVNEHKYQNTVQDIWYPNPNADPSLFSMSNFLGTFHNNNYYFGAYPYGPVDDWSKVINFFNQNPQDFVLDTSDTNFEDSANFNIVSRVTSGFVMNTLQFGKFSLQTGLRFEGTQFDIRGFETDADANGNWLSTTPTENKVSYITPLPSAQLKYMVTSDSDIRAVYGRGLSRPEPYDMVPYIVLSRFSSPPSVSLGNPSLQPEHANDYDLLYEHYIHSSGVIQGGFFYKELSDPIYYTQSLPVTTGQYAGYSVQQIINGTNAHIAGIELAYMQRFSGLPGAFGGLGLNANYTYVESQAHGLPGRTDSPALQRQAPEAFNVIPSYSHGRFFGEVGMTYQGAFIDGYQYTTAADTADLGPKGPGGDDYFYPHFQIDAQFSVNIADGVSVYFNGENLNDEVFGFYNGSPQYVLQREFYRPEYSVGVRWNPPLERK